MSRFVALNREESHDRPEQRRNTEKEEAECRRLYEEALILQRQNDLQRAEDNYQRLLSSSLYQDQSTASLPTLQRLRYVALRNLADIEIRSNRKDAAVSHLVEAVELNDEDAMMWFRLGCAARDVQRYGLARAALSTSLARQPSHWLTLQSLCEVLYLVGDFDEAEALIRTVGFKMDPAWPLGHSLLRQMSKESGHILPESLAPSSPSLGAFKTQTFGARSAVAVSPRFGAKRVRDNEAPESIVSIQQLVESRAKRVKTSDLMEPEQIDIVMGAMNWTELGSQLLAQTKLIMRSQDPSISFYSNPVFSFIAPPPLPLSEEPPTAPAEPEQAQPEPQPEPPVNDSISIRESQSSDRGAESDAMVVDTKPSQDAAPAPAPAGSTERERDPEPALEADDVNTSVNEMVDDMQVDADDAKAAPTTTTATAEEATDAAPRRRRRKSRAAATTDAVDRPIDVDAMQVDAPGADDNAGDAEIIGPSAAAGARKKKDFNETEIKSRLEQAVAVLIKTRCQTAQPASTHRITKAPSNLADTQSDFLSMGHMQLEPEFGPSEELDVKAFLDNARTARLRFLGVVVDFVNYFADRHSIAWGSSLVRIYLELLGTLSTLNMPLDKKSWLLAAEIEMSMVHVLSSSASRPENAASCQRHLNSVQRHAERIFGSNIMDSNVAADEKDLTLQARLLWLQMLLIKRLVTGTTEEEIIAKQEAIINILSDLQRTLDDGHAIVLSNCVSHKTIRSDIVSTMHHEILSRQRTLQARSIFEKGDYQTVADDLAPLARDNTALDTIAAKESEIFELLTLRRHALQRLPTQDVPEQVLCVLAQLKIVNHDLELLTAVVAEEMFVFLSETLKSRSFNFSEAPSVVRESMKQAQLLCLELINSLCSLFASEDDLAKLSMLAGIVCVLLRLEDSAAGWHDLEAFLDRMHDFLAARRACLFAKGVVLRATVDFHIDILSKMQRTLDADKMNQARQKMRAEEGSMAESSDAAPLVPKFELPLDDCSNDAVLELEYQRRQCLCCLFHVDLLEPGSDISLIQSHLQPKEAESGASAAPAPLNMKDPAALQTDQPQHLSSKVLVPTTKPKFVRIIGKASMQSENGRALVNWSLKQLELPMQDVIRPKSKRMASNQAAAKLWYLLNAILAGGMPLDSQKLRYEKRKAALERFMSGGSDTLPEKQNVFPWYDSIFYYHGKLALLAERLIPQKSEKDVSVSLTSLNHQIMFNPLHRDSWDELHKLFSSDFKSYIGSMEEWFVPITQAVVTTFDEFQAKATQYGHNAVRAGEKAVELNPSDHTGWVLLGENYRRLAKVVEASKFITVDRQRDETVVKCMAKAVTAFLNSAQPQGKPLHLYMAAKSAQSFLQKIGILSGAPGMLLQYSPEQYDFGGAPVSAIDVLNLAEIALRRFDDSAKHVSNRKVEPFFKLHSFRLKTACRIWSDPASLDRLSHEDAEALLEKLTSTAHDLAKPRRKYVGNRLEIIQASTKMLDFAGAQVDSLFASEPEFADLRRKMLTVIQNAVTALVMCNVDFSGHAKANYNLARFFHSGPPQFVNPKLALKHLNEVFLLDSTTRSGGKFFTPWHEDLEKQVLQRPGKEIHLRWRLVELLINQLSRDGPLELLALALQKLAPSIILDVKAPHKAEPFARLLENGLAEALQQLENKLPGVKARTAVAIDLLKKSVYVRKAATVLARAVAREDLSAKADKLLEDAIELAFGPKNRPAGSPADAMPYIMDMYPELRHMYEWRLGVDKPIKKRKKKTAEGDAPTTEKKQKRKAPDGTEPAATSTDAAPSQSTMQPETTPAAPAASSETTAVVAPINPDAPASPTKRKRTRKVYEKTRESARRRGKNPDDGAPAEAGQQPQDELADRMDVDLEPKSESESMVQAPSHYGSVSVQPINLDL